MSTLWKTVRSWLTIDRPQMLRDAKLLREVSDAAEMLRRQPDAALARGEVEATKTRPNVASALARFVVATERTIGWSPFEVQLLAAAGMARGEAVEMQTGEGKTLATAAAAAILAFHGRHVHVATVNRYLAQRDFDGFAPVFRRLGLTVGLIHDGQSPDAKRRAYQSNVVYGTGYEFGFDYLREQLRLQRLQLPPLGERYRRRAGAAQTQPLQSSLDCVLVDELDSVLLDEACVPLILSETSRSDTADLALLAHAEATAEKLIGLRHAVIDGLGRTLRLTEAAHTLIEEARPRSPTARLLRPWRQYVEHAVTALALLRRDVDYLIADQKVWLIDASTGRVFADRRWPEGLQQAVEFKERVPTSLPTHAAARITRQRFFRLYRMLAGTSGTLLEAATELRQTYRSRTSFVPPRLPSQRQEWPTRYFVDHASRLHAAAEEAAQLVRQGRPILVGCRTIAASRDVAQQFAARGIPHRVLNGTQTEDEAQVISAAGKSGAVTVATNLAGRGTDILLDDSARRAGGLHVIGIERHDSPRIDRQLLGRAGRQGDPGSGRFFVSAADALFQALPTAVVPFRSAATVEGELPLDLGALTAECQAAYEAEARLRRREVAAADVHLDDILATLAKSE